MKKTIFFLALTISTSIFSQNKFGAFAGINYPTISDGFLKKFYFGSEIAFHIGGLYEFEITDNIVFRPKITYSQQGDREKNNYSFIDVRSIDYKLSYLNVPFNFKFFNKPYLLLGPQVGFLLSTEKQSQDFGNVRSNVDFGANFGMGYDFKNIFLEFNLYQGMSTLIKTQSVFAKSVGFDGTNTVLQLSLGYYFD
ncbi:outer membrane beta-barrel protein [Flavobacteriaceae bacterium SZ-1-7]|uniref:outer membrane beta-barrel protein n=1 Tax=Tamlana sedimenti TaxID=3134126 RepID=UPI0031234249